MDAQISLKEKLELLTPQEQTIMAHIARDYRYQEVANELKLSNSAMYKAVTQLFARFDLPISKWDESYKELARIGRENGFLTMRIDRTAQAPRSQKDPDAPASKTNKEATESAGEPPALDDVVERICKLGSVDAALLRASVACKRGGGGREELARIAGVSVVSLPSRLGKLYVKTLGAPMFPGRKKFLQHALAIAEKKMRAAAKAARVQPEQPEEPLVPALAAEPLPPAPQEETEGHASSGALSTAGHSAVIAIPATVEDADVVAGQFDGTHPACGLEEQIQKRKQGGYKPSFLVLTTTNDPRVTQAQMVFLKHASEQ